MSILDEIANDEIIIKKENGETFSCNKSSIQKNKAFIYCGEKPLEEYDIIIHKIQENFEKEYVVTNACYYKIPEPHYQADIEPKSVFDKKQNETSIKDITISGDNSKVNINSIDNSVNLYHIPFDKIYEKLNEIEDETIKNNSIECLRELEKSKDSETYKNNYVKFISVLSDYVSVITPFLSLLTQIL